MRENLVMLPYARVRFKWIALGVLLLCATLLMLASQPTFAQQNDPPIRLQSASTAPSAPQAPARIVRYVDRSATGSNDGTSWANAYTDLQMALANSVSGTDLWVAEGRYTPHATDRTLSFVLKDGVSLYGGFPEGGGDGTLNARFPAGNPTVLSGNVGNRLLASDNSYHVVYAEGVTGPVVLDGVTISDGYADQGWPNNVGAGIWIDSSFVTLRNCVIQYNYSVDGTPAMRAQNDGNLIVQNCHIHNNRSDGQGSAIIVAAGTVTIQSSRFEENSATNSIGPIWIQDSGATIHNTVIVNNNNDVRNLAAILIEGASGAFMRHLTVSGNSEGAVLVGSQSFAAMGNSILWGNGSPEIQGITGSTISVDSSIVQGGFPGGTNISTDDPLFVSNVDFRLGFNSPAKDSGSRAACLPEDIQGYPRPNLNGCDRGAYEMFTQTIFCQVPGTPIPDNTPGGINDRLFSSSLRGVILDLDLNLVISHGAVSDLIVTLTHDQSNQTQTLLSTPGCSDGADIAVTLDDDGTAPASQRCNLTAPAISGVAAPDKPLAAFNGTVLAGDASWTLNVSDNAGFFTGTLQEWCVVVTTLDSRVVTRLDDPTPNGCQVDDCSLREAILTANSDPRPEAIVFAVDGTFTLSQAGRGEDGGLTGDLDITQPLTIIGNGADKTIIDGGRIDRVFQILGDADVTLSDLTIQNGLLDPGAEVQGGGGILRSGPGRTHLLRTVVRDNSAMASAGGSGLVGGIASIADGSLILEESAVFGNSADFYGGLLNQSADMEIRNSSIYGNTGQLSTIYNVSTTASATLAVRSSTIANNNGSFVIYTFAHTAGNIASIVLENSILHGPSTHCGADRVEGAGAATIISSGHNIAGDDTCNLTESTDKPNTDARLASPGDNDGPTPTLALLDGSPALDAGNDATCPVNDQRGLPRLDRDGNGDGGGDGNPCDIGAYEAPSLLNAAPIADEITASNTGWGSFPVTLTASDADQDPLTYVIVTQPSFGTLSGTAPNLTYKPFPGFIGWDNFTFKVNDGKVDSNTADVRVRVFDNYALYLPLLVR